MAMPGRTFTSQSAYRYGFNGQEKSNKIGEDSYTAEFWEYDSRLGRRWNVDPVTNPSEGSYVAFSDNPILVTDISGAEGRTDGTSPGSGGDNEVNAAYSIVRKHFNPDPEKNRIDITDKLKEDALKWFFQEYNPERNKEYAKLKMSAFANFQALVMNLWQGSIASSFFHRYESNNSAIDAMSTESGKSLATKAFIGKDQTDFSFFFDLVIPTITEFIGVAACGTYEFLSGTGTSATQVTRFSLRNSSKLFSGIPNGAGKLLGQRGEDLTELMLRRAYPNAIIAKQVTFKMGKYLKSNCDFIVINEGKVVAIWESKVNGAIMSKGQEALYLEKQTGVFTGKAAEQYGLSGQGLPAGVGLKEIRYNSTTGAATIFNH